MDFVAENHSPGVDDAAVDNNLKRSEGYVMFEDEESRFPKENGAPRSNGYERDARSRRSEDRQSDVVEDHPGKSRSIAHSSHLCCLYDYRFLWVFFLNFDEQEPQCKS